MGTSPEPTRSVFELTSRFDADELTLILGACTPDPAAVLEPVSGVIAGSNLRFRELVEPPGPGPDVIRIDGYLHPEDLRLFRVSRSRGMPELEDPVEVRIRTASGEFQATQVLLTPLRWGRKDYLIAYFRPFRQGSEVEKELKERVVNQKRKTLEAIKSSLLVYQFTEKIKKTPLLTTSLLGSSSPDEIFERAARILTSEGLNYRGVSFLLREDDVLRVVFSTLPIEGQIHSLEEKSRYTDFFHDGDREVCESPRSILLSLKGHEETLGIMEIDLHERERIFFDDLNLVRKWQKDALTTFGDMIALLLENLRLYEEVRIQSITDPLTGVYNRHYFTDCLPREVQRCQEQDLPLSLIFIDVDHFKQINDSLGHLVGDRILRELGGLLRTNFRGYDFVCRYGGDEFVVLLTEISEDDSRRVAQEFLEVVRGHDFGIEDESLSLSISMGICFCGKEIDGEAFLRSADDALYRAKNSGRNQLVVGHVEKHDDRSSSLIQEVNLGGGIRLKRGEGGESELDERRPARDDSRD